MNKYRIINNTVKPEKYDKNGRDLRTVEERTGHIIGFTDAQNVRQRLLPGREIIVGEITNGLLNLQNDGYVKIIALESVTELLKDHVKGDEEIKNKTAKRRASNGSNTRKKAAKS